MKRNPSVELYRVMLMFGICLLHAVGFGGHGQAWVINILSSCVVGFVFISGWFGVRFSWWKVVKLYGVGVYAAIVLAVGLWATGTEPGAAAACGKAFNQLIHGFWFLHAYALMLCLSPLVNAVCAPSFAKSQNRTIEQSNNPTIRQSHPYPTIKQSNNPTIPSVSNNPTIPSVSNNPTIKQSNTSPSPPSPLPRLDLGFWLDLAVV